MNCGSGSTFAPNRTQFYRNYHLKSHLKQKSLQSTKQPLFWHKNHKFGKGLWLSPNRTNANRYWNQCMANKSNTGLNLLKSSLTAPVKHNPDIKRIVDAYQLTLGCAPIQYDSSDLITMRLETKQTLSDKYSPHIEDVNRFVQRSEFLSTLPQEEMNDNLKNWLNVMLLRSCWWFSFTDEDDMDMLRISGNFGLHREQDKRLEPLFAFAETINVMNLDVIELSLASAYQLLLGTSSFLSHSSAVEKPLTAKRRDYILKLLHSYQKEVYPDETLRYARLLTTLAELTYISLTI